MLHRPTMQLPPEPHPICSDVFVGRSGLVAGLMIGLAVFAQKGDRDARTGRRVRTWGQELVVLLAVVVLLAPGAGAIGAILSADLQELLRTCPFCEHINCIKTPWWSCCNMALQGSCVSIFPPDNATAPIWATCNMTHAAEPYDAYCSPSEDDACSYGSNMEPNDPRLGALCVLICSGCSG